MFPTNRSALEEESASIVSERSLFHFWFWFGPTRVLFSLDHMSWPPPRSCTKLDFRVRRIELLGRRASQPVDKCVFASTRRYSTVTTGREYRRKLFCHRYWSIVKYPFARTQSKNGAKGTNRFRYERHHEGENGKARSEWRLRVRIVGAILSLGQCRFRSELVISES